MYSNCGLLVPSTDEYTDLWEPFLFYLRKFWPDCPFEIILGTNTPTSNVPQGALVQPTVAGINWGEHVRMLLATITSDIVLLVMPDYFLDAPVDTRYIVDCVEYISKSKTGYVRLSPTPPPRRRAPAVGNVGLVELGLREPYSTSLAASLWSSTVLFNLLDDSDSPWTFERTGPERRQTNVQFCTTAKPILSYKPTGALVRGRWTREAMRRLTEDGMEDAMRFKPSMSRCQALQHNVKSAAFRLISSMSPRSVRFFNQYVTRKGARR
jgi:hypothetical protein